LHKVGGIGSSLVALGNDGHQLNLIPALAEKKDEMFGVLLSALSSQSTEPLGDGCGTIVVPTFLADPAAGVLVQDRT
jgi:hypothetical protein